MAADPALGPAPIQPNDPCASEPREAAEARLPGSRARARFVSMALAAGAVAALVGLGAWFTHAYGGNVVDDALISFRYAQNLVEGRGLVFNPGERVEGYTNFLWTMVLAGLYAVAGSPAAMMPWAVGASISVAALALLLVYLLAREIQGDAVVPTIAALGLVALDNAYGVWAIQALEGHFLLVWMLLALLIAERRPRGWPLLLGVSLAAVQMTRWDGFLLALALGASYGLDLVLRWRRGEPEVSAELRGWVGAVAVGALVYGAYFLWRYQYYGYLLPNTFYLKVGTSNADAWARGARYVASYFTERWMIPAAALLALPLAGRPLVRALLLFVAIHLLYVMRVGGDFYPGHRFLLVVTPFLALLVGAVLHALEGLTGRLDRFRAPARAVLALAACAVVTIVAVRGFERGPYRSEILRWRQHIQRMRDANIWLRDYKKPGDVYAQGDIGGTGFFADIPVIDIFGVVDPEVAHLEVPTLGRGKPGHEKVARRDHVLGKQPRFIREGYLHGRDLHHDGYFRSGAMPASLAADWLWERDDLARTGRFLNETALPFEQRGEGWEAEGSALASWPHREPVPGQQPVKGQQGAYVNTFHPALGDDAFGTLRSPPFLLAGDRLILRVGGGNDAENLRVSLLVDGVRVFSETGHDTEVLTRRVWETASFRGKAAILEIVDAKAGGWGHLLVDEVVQWRAHAPTTTASD